MPTRPSTPDPTGASSAQPNPFATLGAGLGAGLDFFQDWIKAAGSALPNMPGAPSATGGMSAWTMPTLDPAELEKRIQDLKTVQFWLEQNARMIAMTIQGLEVQRMTLSTLKGMNVSMDALRESLKARAEPPAATANGHDAPSGNTAAAGTQDSAAPEEASDLINPMRWWDTLTQQFTHLASQAAQTVNESVGESMDMLKQAQAKAAETASRNVEAVAKTAASGATPTAAMKRKPAAPAKPGTAKTAGKTRSGAGASATGKSNAD